MLNTTNFKNNVSNDISLDFSKQAKQYGMESNFYVFMNMI